MKSMANTIGFVAPLMAGALSLLAGCDAASSDDGALDGTNARWSDSGEVGEAATGDDVAKASDYYERGTTAATNPVLPYIGYQGKYMCVLSMVTGNFNGDDRYSNSGHVIVDWADSDFYRFYWRDGWTDGRALCTNWSNFLVGSGGVKQFSGNFVGEVWGFSDQTAEGPTWTGDAITFVTGLDGEMQGGGEYVRAIQSTTVSGKSKLRVHEESGSAFDQTFLDGFAQAFRIGVPGARLIRLRGYNSAGNNVTGNVNSSGTFEFAVSTVSGYSGYWMTPVDDGFCGFTHISGNFDGGGEVIRNYKTDGWWFLKASSTGGKAVYARSRCVAYDQR
jgi:hypothetical protein